MVHGLAATGPQLALLHWDGRRLDLRVLEGANPRLTDLDRDPSPKLLYERRDGTRALLQWDGVRLVEWDVDGRTPQTESIPAVAAGGAPLAESVAIAPTRDGGPLSYRTESRRRSDKAAAKASID